MKTFLTTCVLCVFFGVVGSAQDSKSVAGLWEGTLTVGGINSKSGYKFELWMEQRGSKIRGKTYLHLGDKQVIQMAIKGEMYNDRSIYFNEVEFIPAEGQPDPPFHRRYQLIHNRSIWDSSLEGYWQEVTDEILSKKRHLGRIYLKKVDSSKA